jgi:hypothetical protein
MVILTMVGSDFVLPTDPQPAISLQLHLQFNFHVLQLLTMASSCFVDDTILDFREDFVLVGGNLYRATRSSRRSSHL